MSININRKNPLKRDKSLYRVDIKIPVKFTPILLSGQRGSACQTEMVNISGSGCKIKLPESWLPETKEAIVEFVLANKAYKIHCNVVRRNTPYHIIALQFIDLDREENEIIDTTMKQAEEQIIQFVFERQQEMDVLPQLYRKKL